MNVEAVDATRIYIGIGWNLDEADEMLEKPIPPGEEAYLPIVILGYEEDTPLAAKAMMMMLNPEVEISHIYCLADLLKTVDKV
jgi:hypothetical protein